MRVFLLLSMLAFSSLALADWQVDTSYSRVSFVSVKRGDMADVHYFSEVTGLIDQTGRVRLALPFDSLENTLALQAERMREFVFKADRFPEAIITSQIDPSTWEQMPVDDIRQHNLDLDLELNGQKQRLKAEVSISRLGETLVQVNTLQPVLVKAVDFDLLEGLKKLEEVSSVSGIAPEVPVNVLLTLRQVPSPS
ncbi:YceI-like domain-containing protein [Pseudomonas duriflava]|uniref:YceI-like domain-containing protein n=1 Tax=Pseudomonas duriflava TaxID=459528 RepID=A0A562QP30_9PSED|nr:YceI family protein [Pseudomonas duriflava]TWI58518.1 YceI-like domain-containing protein [Pseudomonas duriflava]